MKRFFVISAIVSVLLLACGKRQEPVAEQPLPFTFDENLLRIDSLLQHDADSALQTLLSFRADSVISTEAQRSGEISCHYHSLLLSEALYKTDNPQLNRFVGVETCHGASLQDAMQYFDSLYANYPKNDDLAMLSARSHYMNGVGYYENDSVVDACKEYLKTLEIMENHFEKNELVGYKAKFMSLTYNRLKELFTDQFIMEPAIYCGKQSLFFCKIAPTSQYGVSKNLAKLGKLYDMSGNTDSAYYYYKEALKSLPDTNNLVYRDLRSSMVLLSYELGQELALEELMQVAKQASSKEELLTRYFTIGCLYYEENIYDSAVVYLNHVFKHEGNNDKKIQAADFLMRIYQSTNDSINTLVYSNYLAQNTLSIYDKTLDSSTLNKLFHNYLNKKSLELQKRNKNRIIIVVSVFFTIAVILYAFILSHSNKKIKKLKKEQRRIIDTERKARYREKNKMLDTIKQQETKVNALEQELGNNRHKIDISMKAFLDEPVCKRINNELSNVIITSRVCYADYSYLKLDETTIAELDEAVTKHFPNFKLHLLSRYNSINQNEMIICQLYLLGLDEKQIAVLTQYHYSTITRKTRNLKQIMKTGVTFSDFIQKTAVL